MSDVSEYRGHSKHKNRPKDEMKGTLCPEWTHKTAQGGLGGDVCRHAWAETEAARLFVDSQSDARGRRYATSRGIAFEAKPTNDGTWHGYPIPWESVPNDLRKSWLNSGLVSRKQIKAEIDKDDIRWALYTDTDDL